MPVLINCWQLFNVLRGEMMVSDIGSETLDFLNVP
jgi:hypothetical protein